MALNQKKIHRAALIVTIGLLSACASAPPSLSFFDDASAGLERARVGEGEAYAPVEMGFARERLEKARNALATKKYNDAMMWAAQSEVDSELAMAKARAGKARTAAQAKASENSRLRAELLDEHDVPANEAIKPVQTTGEQP